MLEYYGSFSCRLTLDDGSRYYLVSCGVRPFGWNEDFILVEQDPNYPHITNSLVFNAKLISDPVHGWYDHDNIVGVVVNCFNNDAKTIIDALRNSMMYRREARTSISEKEVIIQFKRKD